MSDRHQIMDDKEFWLRLEWTATRWLEALEDKVLRHFWIDGFLPDAITNTKRGVDVEGTAWVGDGPRKQSMYHFVVSVPQKMLGRTTQPFCIEELFVDASTRVLRLVIDKEKPSP